MERLEAVADAATDYAENERITQDLLGELQGLDESSTAHGELVDLILELNRHEGAGLASGADTKERTPAGGREIDLGDCSTSLPGAVVAAQSTHICGWVLKVVRGGVELSWSGFDGGCLVERPRSGYSDTPGVGSIPLCGVGERTRTSTGVVDSRLGWRLGGADSSSDIGGPLQRPALLLCLEESLNDF